MKKNKSLKNKKNISGVKNLAPPMGEATEVLEAIKAGEIDALFIKDQVHQLKSLEENVADEKKFAEFLEAHYTLKAIKEGEIDALFVSGKVYTLEGADYTYRKLVEQMQEGALTLSNGIILYCNRYFATMMGVTIDQITGSALINLVADNDRPIFEKMLVRAIHSDTRKKICFISKKKQIPAYVSMAPLQIDGVNAVCVAVTDLTEASLHAETKVQLEEQISVSEEMKYLNEKLKQRTNELALANKRLLKLDESKTHFLAIASHELKTPTSAVKGFIDVLQSEAQGALNDAQKNSLKFIKEGAERLWKLVHSLLDLSKIELGQMTMRINPGIDLKKILKNVVLAAQPIAGKKGISLKTNIAVDLHSISGDEDRLREVFDNLVSNALKYTPNGGSITVYAKNFPKTVEVSIKDTGIGIKKEDQQRIFEPFMHLRKSGLEGEDSTGLGLALVKKILEAHLAKIQVRSVLGKGSIFTVKFPLKYGE